MSTSKDLLEHYKIVFPQEETKFRIYVKCNSLVSSDRNKGRLVIDNIILKEEAKIVREIFERFANGEKKQQIVDDLNNRQIKTALGRKFCVNSFSKMLSNKRYIGIYTYKGTETPGGMPRIISDDLFQRVQERLKSDKITKGTHEVKEDYILTSKLFCGNCNELMTGYSGTSKSDQKYYYYICKNTKKHKCSKKIVPKKEIEELVVNECLKLLNKDSINHIIKEILKQCNELNESLS